MLEVKKFYATWCGPCKMLTPIMENVKGKFSNVQFEDIDIDSIRNCTEVFCEVCTNSYHRKGWTRD